LRKWIYFTFFKPILFCFSWNFASFFDSFIYFVACKLFIWETSRLFICGNKQILRMHLFLMTEAFQERKASKVRKTTKKISRKTKK